ncbi:MAG: DNA translocase FtsK [Cloacibacterium sp.]|nr:DNA translocase FtsK [Cloacibacterium sp.]
MKNTAQHSPTTPVKTKTLPKFRIIFGVLFFFISLMLTLSFVSYLLNWRADQSQAGYMLDKTIKSSNIFGKIGDWLGNVFIFDSIGIAAFIVAFLFLVIGLVIFKKNYFKPWKTISHSLFFICWLPIFMGAVTQGEGVMSGVFGYQIYDYLTAIIGNFGLWLVLLVSIALYFVLEFNLSPSNVSSKWNHLKENVSDRIEKTKNKEENPTEDSSVPEEEENNQNLSENYTLPSSITLDIDSKPNDEPLVQDFGKTQFDKPYEPIKTPNNTSEKTLRPESDITVDLSEPSFVNDNISLIIEERKEEELIIEPEDKAKELVDKHGFYDHKLDLANFKTPPIDLLKDYGNESISVSKDELEENKNKIVGLLKNFNVGIAHIKATIGPTVTLYEIVPEAGIRVAAIKKLQDDIALNLSALGIRIIAPMPGKGTIGIEVPRKNPSMVSMRSVIASPKFQNSEMDLPVVFGKTISNEIFVADLAKMPHLLMAGATGQGKSVGINAILTSLLYKKHPSELKFVMVDPKKVELSLYSKIERHYLAKLPDGEDAIITDTTKVINTLNSLCIEMDNRYDLLKNAFCKNLKEYNQKFKERKLNPENGHRYLPYIVLVVDEFADLIMTAGKEVEMPIARLAQLARAIGIHLIVATQRPSVNVITGMIKANFPARVAFRVISGVDSKTILDSPGAEQLVGKGDMLFFNGNDLTRLQCAFVDTPEVEKIAEYIGEQKGYAEAYQLPEYIGEGENSSVGSFDANEKDSLFEEAARIVVGTQQGSTSMLQRQLKLGYNRAGRIMDQLEAAGIVSGFNGAKARDVLINDMHSLEQFLNSLRN